MSIGFRMDREDLKEKLAILSITTGIFLPIRVLFSAYVSEHWLGSLGLISVFGILFLYFIKKDKLGWFGRIFEKQMRKTIGGKTGKYVIGISILFLVYFGLSLYFMDKGSTVYDEDKDIFFSAFLSNEVFSVEQIPIEQLKGPELSENFEGVNWILKIDYALSIAFSIMNDSTDGWLSHFVVVIFVEQLEIMLMLFIYRKTYRKKISIPTEE